MRTAKPLDRLRLLFLGAGMFLPYTVLAQEPAYFPLQTGNSWLYRSTNAGGSDFTEISVEGREVAGDREYFRVRYFGQLLLLRAAPGGGVVQFDPGTRAEQPWLSPALPAGSAFPAPIDHCTETGRIAERDGKVSTPAGQFSNTVRITFEGRCADAGTREQVYAPDVGLTVHEESSFAGPRRYELAYYKAGARSEAAPEVSFTVALNAARYSRDSELGVRLTLRNTTRDAVTLVFPSGQSYDLKIVNAAGDVVYVWSAARIFPLIYREEEFGPGERTYGFTAPLNGLPPGRYKAQAYLTTTPTMYLGEVSFEIAP